MQSRSARWTILIPFLLLLSWGCGTPPGGSESPGGLQNSFRRIGRELARDLAETFRSSPYLWMRGLSWKDASPREKRICTRALARSLAEATGWKVLLERPAAGPPRALLEIRGKVEEGGRLLETQGDRVVEFTVRLAGGSGETGSPWTTGYTLEEGCSGFT